MFDWLFGRKEIEFEPEGKTLIRMADGIQAVAFLHHSVFHEAFTQAFYYNYPLQISHPDEPERTRYLNPQQVIYYEPVSDDAYEAMKHGASQAQAK